MTNQSNGTLSDSDQSSSRRVYITPCALDLRAVVEKGLEKFGGYRIEVGKRDECPSLFDGHSHYALLIGPSYGSRHVTVAIARNPRYTVYRRVTHKGLGKMIMKLEPGV